MATKPAAVVIPIANGSEPEILELDDLTEVYGVDFPEIDTPCDLSPSGQCEYSWRDNFRVCIHCRKPSGLDE